MNFFNKAYAKYAPENRAWLNGLFSASIVLLIFLLFQPFGFRDKDLQLKIILFPTYALLAFVQAQVVFFIVRQMIKKSRTWTLGHELISFLMGAVVLTIAIHLVTYWVVGDMPLSFQWYFKLLYHVTSLYLFIGIIEFYYYKHKSADISNQYISSQYELAKQKLDNVQKEVITISLEKEHIKVSRDKIIFIKSMGNYVEFYLREQDGNISHMSKRGRIQKAEKDLVPYTEFFRCHRAFIINLKQVIRLKGNMKNAMVIFEDGLEKVPVSRTSYTTLKERLEQVVLT